MFEKLKAKWDSLSKRSKIVVGVVVLFVLLALAGGQASAQGQNCGPRDMVIERLASKYGETRRSIGMAPQGRVVEVFASAETGTWTITVTLPNGMTCLVASGQNHEPVDEAPVKEGDPA